MLIVLFPMRCEFMFPFGIMEPEVPNYFLVLSGLCFLWLGDLKHTMYVILLLYTITGADLF